MKLRTMKIVVTLVVFLMSIFSLYHPQTIEAVADNGFMSLDLNTTTPSVSTGQEIRMSVDYGFSELVTGYNNVVLTIEVPSQINGGVITASNMPIVYTDGSTDNIVPVITGNVIKYTVPTSKTVVAGYTSRVELIKVATSRMLTLPGTLQPKATLSAVAETAMSIEDRENIVMRIAPDWRIQKTPQFTTYNENTYARYRMFIQVPNVNGNIAAKSIVVTDQIPSGMTFVAFDSPTDSRIQEVHPGLVPSDSSTWQGAKAQPFSNNTASYPAGNVSISGDTM